MILQRFGTSSLHTTRQNYYNYHTDQKWGEYKNYNLSLNSSYISEDEAAALIAAYVEHRRYKG